MSSLILIGIIVVVVFSQLDSSTQENLLSKFTSLTDKLRLSKNG